MALVRYGRHRGGGGGGCDASLILPLCASSLSRIVVILSPGDAACLTCLLVTHIVPSFPQFSVHLCCCTTFNLDAWMRIMQYPLRHIPPPPPPPPPRKSLQSIRSSPRQHSPPNNLIESVMRLPYCSASHRIQKLAVLFLLVSGVGWGVSYVDLWLSLCLSLSLSLSLTLPPPEQHTSLSFCTHS